MKYIVPINPVPAARPRVTRWATFYPKIYAKFKEDIAMWLLTQKKTMLSGPLSISATFYIKIPSSISKKKREELDGQWCDKNYDTDNLQKSLFDGINGYLIEDDRFIVHVKDIKKMWSSNPRIEFELEKL